MGYRTCGSWIVVALLALSCGDEPTSSAGPPAVVQIASGDQQAGTVATALGNPVVVLVADANDKPVPGVLVTFFPAAGTAQPAAVETGSTGRASTVWTLGTAAGPHTMQVHADGILATVSATATAAAPTSMAIVGGRGQAGTRGTALSLPIVARVSDAYGNPKGGVTVAFQVSDNGTIAPTSAATDGAGQGQATWTLGSKLGKQTVTATVTGLGSDTASAQTTVPMTVLSHIAIDAVYDSVGDRLITVSGDPDRLNVIDPTTANVTSIALDLTPAAVSVQPDGAYAAVGHNGFISYVNLTTMAVVRVYSVTADVLDLELPGNGWVYAFPRRDQWESIRSIELSTGNETLSGYATIYAGTLAKLHPSGQYIYGADNGLSPSDFEKYDIRSGAAIPMYDSPYHGDYSFGGDLWMYETGTRIVARSGNVFTASSVQSQDMLYVGSLGSSWPVSSAAHSTELQRIVVVRGAGYSSAPPSELQSYTDTFLASRGAVPLPPYVETDVSSTTLYPSEGRFVFAHRAGMRVYVLLRGAAPYQGRFTTGLALFEMADIP